MLAVTDDGSTLYFRTQQGNPPLINESYYRRSGGTTTVPFPNGPGLTPSFCGISPDGSRIRVASYNRLSPNDTDPMTFQGSYLDVFESVNGAVSLVSTGPASTNAAADAHCHFSNDATTIFFSTSESLVSGDTDSSFDVYERVGASLSVISTGSSGGNGPDAAQYVGSSENTSRVFFSTAEKLEPEDTDAAADLYERTGGTTTLLSYGPDGGNDDSFPVHFARVNADGSRVVFWTVESLVDEDTDAAADLYERSEGQTTLVTTGPAGGNGDHWVDNQFALPATGPGVLFKTAEQLVSGDTDDQVDVYEWTGAATRLLSIGPAGATGRFPWMRQVTPGTAASRTFGRPKGS